MILRKGGESRYIDDPALSLKAKGLMALLLALPPDFNPTMGNLVGLSRDGTSALSAAMGELKAAGYIKAWQERDPKSSFFGESAVELTGK